MNAAGIILAGGAQEIGAVFWAALAVAVLAAAAGVFFVLLFRGIARWRQIRGEALDASVARHPAGSKRIAEFGSVAEALRQWSRQEDGRA